MRGDMNRNESLRIVTELTDAGREFFDRLKELLPEDRPDDAITVSSRATSEALTGRFQLTLVTNFLFLGSPS